MISLRTKIFVRKKTHVSEEKKKKKQYCAITFELHSNVMFHLKVQILFNKAKKNSILLRRTKTIGLLKESCTVKPSCQQEGGRKGTKLRPVPIHWFYPKPFIYSFIYSISTSFSLLKITINAARR